VVYINNISYYAISIKGIQDTHGSTGIRQVESVEHWTSIEVDCYMGDSRSSIPGGVSPDFNLVLDSKSHIQLVCGG